LIENETKLQQNPNDEKKEKEVVKKFVVRPFAVMRLSHEAIRFAVKDIEEASKDKDVKIDRLQTIYNDLERMFALHGQQEDDVFFPLLDKKFDEIISKKGILSIHSEDTKLRNNIKESFDSKDKLIKALKEWTDHLSEHMKVEEEVMMPLTMKTADSVEERGAIVRNIINVNRKEFTQYQFEYVLNKLVKHKPFGAVLMYCKAVQMASNKEEYDAVKTKIEGIVGEEIWKKLQSKGVQEDGKQK